LKILFLDVDNTIVPFQPTAELYKRTLLKQNNIKYIIAAYFMIIILKMFWYLPRVVEFQRKIIMSLLSSVDRCELEKESENIVLRVVESYEKGFSRILAQHKEAGDKVFLLTHCPDLISRKIASALKLDGEYSIKIENYFQTKGRPNNINKLEILRRIKANNQDVKIYYFADDLIDVKCLMFADKGFLVNGSIFTKCICNVFYKKLIQV